MILGLSPFVILFLISIWQEPGAVLSAIGVFVALMGCVILACYGLWEMNVFNHCGDFWESASCDGKVITNR